jgi:hypothetical protein
MRAKNIQERITQFEKVHTNKYDYSLLVEPIRWDSKIKVICPEHGVFTTLVNNHSRGAGCIKCAGTYLKSRSERIYQANKVHNSKYGYSKLPAKVNSKDKVSVTCLEHGDFTVTLANHINHKSGCPHCSNSIERTYDKFVKQATNKHGDKYGYKLYNDVTRTSLISIICPEHGEFEQTVDAHLAGKGCQTCGKNSIGLDEEAVVYILKTEGMFKVGVSSRFDSRLNRLINGTPFDFEVVHVKKFKTRREAFASEKEILNSFPSANLTGFDGATEWLLGDPCYKYSLRFGRFLSII